jgi:membrane-associated protease RseP (regulator of RpoE activity)
MEEQISRPSFEPLSRLEIIGQLRAQLVDVMPDVETLWSTQMVQQDRTGDSGGNGPTRRTPTGSWLGRIGRSGSYPRQNPTMFRGHLAVPPGEAYEQIRQRFETLGYTPLLRQEGEYDVVIAIPYVFQSGSGQMEVKRWIPNVILLLLTVVTTTLMGAVLEQGSLLAENPLIFFQQPLLLLTGIPASLTIMSILGIHELAHYFVARRHGLDTTLPYFIPVPFGFGTFGAIIRIRTPWEDRKALFDVGLAGPLAGLLIALPLFFIGLLLSPAKLPIPDEGMTLGSPLLLRWIEDAVRLIRGIPQEHEIYVNAMTFAAWFGLVVTGFNLLPVGQLDGGHVAYAVLGRWAKTVGIVVLAGLAVLGFTAWNGWFVWAAFIFFSGWQHPAPLNALSVLDKKRLVIGILVFVLIILLFTPSPFLS